MSGYIFPNIWLQTRCETVGVRGLTSPSCSKLLGALLRRINGGAIVV